MPRKTRDVPWLADRNGHYYAFWYNPETKRTERLSLRTTDVVQAQAAFAEFLVHGAAFWERRGPTLTVAQALDDYYREHVVPNVADKTRQADSIKHLKAFFGDKALEDVGVLASRKYAAARMTGKTSASKSKRPVSPSTVRRELHVLVAAANHAVWMERAKVGVKVELPPEKRLGVDDEAPYLQVEEVERLIDAAEGELKLFIQLAYLTGARRRSIQELTRSQVRWAQKRIMLQPPGKVSTKKRQPILPILKAMEAPLRELWETGGPDRLFRTADFYRPFRELCERCGIEKGRSHPHVLRHSRASHLLQEGRELFDVARLLGDSVSTIERVYGHHSHDRLAGNLEG